MADLFPVTAPLLIGYPDCRRDVMEEHFMHGPGQSLAPGYVRNNGSPSPAELVCFRPFRDREDAARAICLVQGEVRGEGRGRSVTQ